MRCRQDKSRDADADRRVVVRKLQRWPEMCEYLPKASINALFPS
jgi:hypothetical protein